MPALGFFHIAVLAMLVMACAAQRDPQLRNLLNQRETVKLHRGGSESFLSPLSASPLQLTDKLMRNYPYMRANDPGPLAFLFHDLGSLVPAGRESIHVCEYCFHDSNVTLVATGQKGARITFDVGRPTSLLCSDNYLLATSHHIYLKSFFFAGHHSVDISFDSEAEYADVLEHGIKLLAFNESLLSWVEATLDLVSLFLGEHPVHENLKFLKRYMNITWPAREDPTPIDIPESQIRSGDVFLTQCLNGMDSLIAYGTGSHVGHATVALWIQGELHVCESTVDKNIGNGVSCTPYKRWLDLLPHRGFIALYLPLRPDVRQHFDEARAVEFVQRMLGQPYGFRNILFTWVDTVGHNFPAPFTSDLVAVYASIVDALGGYWHQIIYNFSLEGVNKRLDHYFNGLGPVQTMRGLWDLLAANDLTHMDVISKPELDEWKYTDGYAQVCSSFVVRVLKAAGVFGTLSVQGTEHTPRDLYQLSLYDTDPARFPKACARDRVPWCQIGGKYRIDLPGFNTVQPYAHMNERCGGLPPHYERTPHGC